MHHLLAMGNLGPNDANLDIDKKHSPQERQSGSVTGTLRRRCPQDLDTFLELINIGEAHLSTSSRNAREVFSDYSKSRCFQFVPTLLCRNVGRKCTTQCSESLMSPLIVSASDADSLAVRVSNRINAPCSVYDEFDSSEPQGKLQQHRLFSGDTWVKHIVAKQTCLSTGIQSSSESALDEKNREVRKTNLTLLESKSHLSEWRGPSPVWTAPSYRRVYRCEWSNRLLKLPFSDVDSCDGSCRF